MTLLVSASQTGWYYITTSPLQGISQMLRRLNGWTTYPKVIAFLIPGPSCYGNIILLLSKSVMWLFLIMIWLFCRVPCGPSGACQLYPRYVKPLTAPCTNTGTTARCKQPQGCVHWCRDQGDVEGFVFHPCYPAAGCSVAVAALLSCPQVRMGLGHPLQLMGNAFLDEAQGHPYIEEHIPLLPAGNGWGSACSGWSGAFLFHSRELDEWVAHCRKK